MEAKHQLFESMLHEKGMTKRAFSEYAKIPYYTVAGWKKSGKVPPYLWYYLPICQLPKLLPHSNS